MLIAGDLYVGRDLMLMDQLGVSGNIDLRGKEVLEVGGLEPSFDESTEAIPGKPCSVSHAQLLSMPLNRSKT
jgi:hypothetical protein